MPRRSILSASERDSLLALPDSRDDLIRRYTFSESDLSIIRQRRGAANRLGFAVQLCYLRYPGIVLGVNQLPLPALLHRLPTVVNDIVVECGNMRLQAGLFHRRGDRNSRSDQDKRRRTQGVRRW